MCNVVLVSGILESDSVIRMHASVLFSFFTCIGCYRVLVEFPALPSRSLLMIHLNHTVRSLRKIMALGSSVGKDWAQ